jgi:hypothetical protein
MANVEVTPEEFVVVLGWGLISLGQMRVLIEVETTVVLPALLVVSE